MSATAEPTDLKSLFAENPGLLFETVAKEHGVTCRDAIAALPDAMRRIAPGDRFMEAMGDIAGWGEVTVIIHTDDGIMEFTGPVPAGQEARGYYNLMSRTGFHGHLRHDRCGGIAFVERAFMNRPSASVLFINVDGGIMLKVFVGRGEGGALREDQLAAFHALADRLGAVT